MKRITWLAVGLMAVMCVSALAQPVEPVDEKAITKESAVRDFFGTLADNVEPIVAYDFVGKEPLGGFRCQVAKKDGVASFDIGLLGDEVNDLALICGISADVEGLANRVGWEFVLPGKISAGLFGGARLQDKVARKGKKEYMAGVMIGYNW